MKIRLDIDCTPQEARTFFGLPDLEPIQESLMQEVEARIKKGLDLMDPATALKTWMPGTMATWEEFWSTFLAQRAAASPEPPSARKPAKKKTG